MRFFERVIEENGIDGKVLCCVVIPDYHMLYSLEHKYKHLFMRYSMFHGKPPFLKCFCKKAYLDQKVFQRQVLKLDEDIDSQLYQNIEATNLAFIAFDKISVARQIKDIVT